ncbi:MAG: hypothetical protein I3273_00450 [Candidatus Moeniiplasma glomeromycotorum]|nr:hypothetical protein [Candidatus Moeniiplasma glomeromycotorum]MCE8167404.1 hypothetical protein [Candidatus Moeniiplasma glomeromycotorum]MCE8168582.1 hypothetical protein [Candidatus Moeniiplasma glomeromycotorum]
MKNQKDIQNTNIEKSEPIVNNQQTITFLKNRLADLPENMKKDWNWVQQTLTKNLDIMDKNSTWQKDFVEADNYKSLKTWHSLVFNLSKLDPQYWNWEEYWTYCRENNGHYWNDHATCYYKITRLKQEREKVADLLLEMFRNKNIKDTAKMGRYGIQKIIEIMKELPTIGQEYLKHLTEEKLEELIRWKSNNHINEIIDWGNEEGLSNVVVEKMIEWEEEKLEVELKKLPKTGSQVVPEEELESVDKYNSIIQETELAKSDLVSQVEAEKLDLDKLVELVKNRLSEEMRDIFEKLFEIQVEIVQKGNDFAKGQLEAMKWILHKKLSSEELENILTKKTKIIKLEAKIKKLDKKLENLNQLWQSKKEKMNTENTEIKKEVEISDPVIEVVPYKID